eukprot:7293285-Pyramimonas_sp.AAC.1
MCIRDSPSSPSSPPLLSLADPLLPLASFITRDFGVRLLPSNCRSAVVYARSPRDVQHVIVYGMRFPRWPRACSHTLQPDKLQIHGDDGGLKHQMR